MGLYGQVPGGMFGGDEFARPGYTDPRQAIETCGAVEMMISEQILLRITGDPKWADRCENVAFNTLPATMTADMKALRYLTSPNQVNSDARSKAPELADGGPMQVMNPHDHRCCQHNAGAGWPYFADSLWCATPGNGLAAVFYAASTVKAKVGGGATVTIEEQTQYPFDGTVKFSVAADAPVAFPLYLRVPGWCANAAVEINGQAVPVSSRPGAFLRVDRTWKPGDTLTLKLPLDIRLTTWEKNQNSRLGPPRPADVLDQDRRAVRAARAAAVRRSLARLGNPARDAVELRDSGRRRQSVGFVPSRHEGVAGQRHAVHARRHAGRASGAGRASCPTGRKTIWAWSTSSSPAPSSRRSRSKR